MPIGSAITATLDLQVGDEGARRRTHWVAGAFLCGMVLQAAGYFALGTGRSGMAISEFLMLGLYAISMACAWGALHRAQGAARLFWLLFLATDIVLTVPSVIQFVETYSGHSLISPATWRAIYVLYGAPVLMMLVLPDCSSQRRIPPAVLLDLFQIALVVGLAFSVLFYVPLQQMLPADALERNLTASNLVSLLLLLAVLTRLRSVQAAAARDRILRLGAFLFTCAIVTFIGNWIDQHHYTAASAWWDLGWDVPILAASLGAAGWQTSLEPEGLDRTASFVTIFLKNLLLIAVLFSVKRAVDQWNEGKGAVLTQGAIVSSFIAYALRLALTQHKQQQEIAERKAAQTQLTEANSRIGILLEGARRQTADIAQINELVSLLQACSSLAESYSLTSHCLQRLVPGASGCLAAMNPARDHMELITAWGPNPPKEGSFPPSDCWALRRGCPHIFSGFPLALRCSHTSAEASSVCVPLIANGVAVGTLAVQIQEESQAPSGTGSATTSESFRRSCDLVVAIGTHLSLALANLQMREALRLQAVRDPLTGLYNRRYMQEFLDRETTRASRNKRPVSVLALDLDHFKSFNDNYGHATGDLALKLVGEFLLDSVRSDDVACRYGGEEFTIILPECSLQQAMRRGEQIRAGLERRSFEHKGKSHTVTVSIGVAAFDETTDRVERLLACADEALYEAKRAGRNRVVAAPPVAPPAPVQADAAVSGLS